MAVRFQISKLYNLKLLDRGNWMIRFLEQEPFQPPCYLMCREITSKAFCFHFLVAKINETRRLMNFNMLRL
ncbi:hypothetical protein HNY73_012213 [Argiope bruennichi]|uniref:Uncharacterized protein n=1 Tax=Argiope bruennichi TaxID=94029 RepID=A0A8T0EYN3_ARGBR|nr:hypothetical protein HNY73_012213 [Argiope bruennichi]